jgi:hypothetical protein
MVLLRALLAAIVLLLDLVSRNAQAGPIPKVWDEAALADWAAPMAGLGARPAFFSEREYYAVPGDNYRTYPVYHPDREPAGYWERLQRLKPELLVDSRIIRTKQEWIAAGRRAWEELDAPSFRSSDPEMIARARSRDVLSKVPVQPDGTIFALRWVVTDKGLQLSYIECASCHTRFMSDGSRIAGAPQNQVGNYTSTGGIGTELFYRELQQYFTGEPLGTAVYKTFAAPWVKPDVHDQIRSMSRSDLDGLLGSIVGGTFPRINGSPYFTTKIPDLIGIKDRKYIDHTATHRHRGPGDFMRYASLIQGADVLSYGAHQFFNQKQRHILYRYDDAVLYAVTQYVYSLEPPPNPNPFDDLAARGQKVFAREGCPGCHTPPLYTNNKLTLAEGHQLPANHPFRADVLPVSVGTDPGLALKTRKGTGLYKVPALRGVWYRGLYLHDGSVASLEEMFDANRLSADHIPEGWKGPGVTRRAIPGHPFGLKLPSEDKTALLAFLRTL